MTISNKHKDMYMRIALTVSEAGTCDRAQVGAVLVKNGAILGTGFNGSSRGEDQCNTHGHIIENNHCIRAIHAEENAIINAAKNGVSTVDAAMFCTHLPCYRCCQRLVNAGIAVVFYLSDYGSKNEHRDKILETTLRVKRHVMGQPEEE